MDTSKHVITIPVADYDFLIKNQKDDKMKQLPVGNPLYENIKNFILHASDKQLNYMTPKEFLDKHDFYIQEL